MMEYFDELIEKRWFMMLAGALMVCALIWFFGPLLPIGSWHPLASRLSRGIACAVILILWFLELRFHRWRERKENEELAEGVAKESEADRAETASAEEVAALTEHLKDAMAALKKARLGGRGRYLYQLPWYMFIGPPGSGKTTALANCGLRFPLADKFGPGAIRGVGGTRNCDWWFTDQAVLIDTAGRYTTQDSDAKVDSTAWLGFLKLLKQHRKRQPLNGVLVAISLSDLATLSESERSAHARAIRKRVRELQDELGVRMPIYVLFTKADLIAGFVECFDNLGKEEREQVWGMTFALDDNKSEEGSVAEFGRDFDQLIERLNDRMLERVHQEPDVNRRRLIYGFPQQIASLRDVAASFLTEAFRPSRLEARPLLRGVYFTSGTQNGTPIDRLLGAMAGEFGLPRQAVTGFSGAGRSYFLSRLVGEVIFGEAGLVNRDPKVERRQRVRQYAGLGVCGVIVVVALGLWSWSWSNNRQFITDVHAAAARYNTQYAELARNGAHNADLRPILPALATLRSVRGGYEDRTKPTPTRLTFGLYQGVKLGDAADDAYARALDDLLLPRLMGQLEVQIQASMAKPAVLYEALKVYLMLGRQGPLDSKLIEQWTNAMFAAEFPGEDGAATREALSGHVKAMLAQPLPSLKLNGPLVEEARAVLNREPLANYLYNRILRSGIVQGLPKWTVAENAGPEGARVFVLRDGKPLSSGVPGIFTYEGYHRVLLPLLPRVTKDAAEDEWVLGREAPTTVASERLGKVGKLVGSNEEAHEEMEKLRRNILGLYLDDYTRHWDALLANVALKPFSTLQQGQDELFALSAPDSPLRDLLVAIDKQTQPGRSAESGEKKEKAEKAKETAKGISGIGAEIAREGLTYEQNEVLDVLGDAFGKDKEGKPIDPAERVDEHFEDLHKFVVGTPDQKPRLEAVLAELRAIYQGINKAANAPNQGAALLSMVGGGGGGGAPAAAAQLQAIAQTVPKPIAAMLQTVSQSSTQVTTSGATAQLSDAWQSKVLPLCKEAFNRYPFVAGSSQAVPLEDFTHLLGPGGLMDQFFDKYLKPFVNTTTTPWQWQSAQHTQLGLSPGALTEFERAAKIRDALFPTGSQMMVKFQLVPAQLDPGVASVSVEIAGQRLSYAHGPDEPMNFQWPGGNGATGIRLTMTPTNGGPATVVQNNGPWALLRLLDAGKVVNSGQPDKFKVIFTSPAGKAVFQLNAASVRNPFTLGALRAFRCPAKL